MHLPPFLPLFLFSLPTLARDPLGDTISGILKSLLDQHDHTWLPARVLHPNLTYTENNIVYPIGTTPLWKNAVQRPVINWYNGWWNGHFDHDSMQAVAILVIEENSVPALLVMRMRMDWESGAVTELELQIVRDDVEGADHYVAVAKEDGPNAMGPEWEEDLSGGEARLTAAKVYELGKGYYEGKSVTGFWEGCYRIDNGRPKTSCADAPAVVQASKVHGRGRRFLVAAANVQRKNVFSVAIVDIDGSSWLVAESLRFNGLELIDRMETSWTEVPYRSAPPFEQAAVKWSTHWP
ncbi:hypothetical protein B0T14DRAFT_195917 [Immersiella caudata]|uniref:Uncharacterized protein n=1 Tax=Immersiella caudata TaxID=314043 RepID=A0AA39WZA8_9PEZI|nr:hypothetical protein B0T14DRAFT_195917 [Immersiella caudata]